MSLLWFALAAFAIGTEAQVIAGLLPAISADLHISASAAGQLVTVYSLAYAVGSPVLAVLFHNIDRKSVLIAALASFIVSNLLAAVAPSFPLLMVSRVLMSLGAGLCTPTALGVAVAIAPAERRSRAVALVMVGMTTATVMGVPLGTVIGNQISWRATFVMVALLGILALAGILMRMPRNLPRNIASLSERLAVARNTSVLIALVVTVLWGMSAVSVFTYLAIPLRDIGFNATQVTLTLFVFGAMAAIGNMAGGTLADRFGPVPTAAIALAGVAASLFLLSALLKSVHPFDLTHYLVLLPIAVWGVCALGFFPAHTANIIRAEPHAAQIALSLNYSAMYLGYGLGGALGGLMLSTLGPADLGWVGGSCAAAALAVLLLLVRRERLQTA